MKRILATLMVLATVGVVPVANTHAQTNERCFPETGFCISGPIRTYWESNGGLAVFGYPTAPLETTQIEDWTGPAQWFERDRLEDHNAQGQGVLAGRLGAERLEQLGRPWQQNTGAPNQSADCRTFPETGYSMCGEIRAYWENNGGLERFGYPLTAETNESIDGQNYAVQYFERRRMELHPENQRPYNVLLGLLGNEIRANTRVASECSVAVLGELQGNYREFNRNGQLGCPLVGEDTSYTESSTARFERGQMYWVNRPGGRSIIIAVYYEPNNTLSYQIFNDTWTADDPETTGLKPPAGLSEPRRGFNKVWREQAGVREKIGWALETERQEWISYQGFEGGSLMKAGSESVVWMFKDGVARNAAVLYN